jgi:hypothetical protein
LHHQARRAWQYGSHASKYPLPAVSRDSASSFFSSSSSGTCTAADADAETSRKSVGSPSVMGTWTTERGAVAIPGAAEADCHCTAGVASIALVSIHTSLSSPARPYLQKMKRHDSRTPSSELIKYSFHHQMKWNEMNCTVSNYKWNEMKWNVTDFSSRRREMKFMKWIFFMKFHEILWDKKGSPNEVKALLVYIIFVSRSLKLSLVFLSLSSLELLSTHIHTRVGVCVFGSCAGGSEKTPVCGLLKKGKKNKKEGNLGTAWFSKTEWSLCITANCHEVTTRRFSQVSYLHEKAARCFLEVCFSAFVCASVRVPAASYLGNCIRSRKK